MRYARRPDGMIIRTVEDEDGVDEVATIPADEGNRDYAEFLAHVEDGGDVEELPEPPPDPAVDHRATIVVKARAYLTATAPTVTDREAQVRHLTRLVLGDLDDVT